MGIFFSLHFFPLTFSFILLPPSVFVVHLHRPMEPDRTRILARRPALHDAAVLSLSDFVQRTSATLLGIDPASNTHVHVMSDASALLRARSWKLTPDAVKRNERFTWADALFPSSEFFCMAGRLLPAVLRCTLDSSVLHAALLVCPDLAHAHASVRALPPSLVCVPSTTEPDAAETHDLVLALTSPYDAELEVLRRQKKMDPDRMIEIIASGSTIARMLKRTMSSVRIAAITRLDAFVSGPSAGPSASRSAGLCNVFVLFRVLDAHAHVHAHARARALGLCRLSACICRARCTASALCVCGCDCSQLCGIVE